MKPDQRAKKTPQDPFDRLVDEASRLDGIDIPRPPLVVPGLLLFVLAVLWLAVRFAPIRAAMPFLFLLGLPCLLGCIPALFVAAFATSLRQRGFVGWIMMGAAILLAWIAGVIAASLLFRQLDPFEMGGIGGGLAFLLIMAGGFFASGLASAITLALAIVLHRSHPVNEPATSLDDAPTGKPGQTFADLVDDYQSAKSQHKSAPLPDDPPSGRLSHARSGSGSLSAAKFVYGALLPIVAVLYGLFAVSFTKIWLWHDRPGRVGSKFVPFLGWQAVWLGVMIISIAVAAHCVFFAADYGRRPARNVFLGACSVFLIAFFLFVIHYLCFS